MARSSTATPEQFTTIADHPRVREIAAALTPLRDQFNAQALEHAAAHRAGGYTNVFTHEPAEPHGEEDIAVARVRLLEIPRERTMLRAKMAPLERALASAESEARAELRARFAERKRPIVARLSAKLAEAARINDELTALEADEAAHVGSVSAVAWPELQPESPTTASRLATWRRFARAEGLTD